MISLIRKLRLREVHEIARKIWVFFDATPSVLRSTPHLSNKQMVNGGMQSLTPPAPSQDTCSQCAGLGDGSLKQHVKVVSCTPFPARWHACSLVGGDCGKR